MKRDLLARYNQEAGTDKRALAHMVSSPAEVDAVLAEAEAAGARITRAAGTMFWGGYSGGFVDPDGHPWEVPHNPAWTLEADGAVSLG